MTIPVTPDIAAKLAARKADFDASRARPTTRNIQVYVCALCKHRGGTLRQEGRWKVCANRSFCAANRQDLKAAEREKLDQIRRRYS